MADRIVVGVDGSASGQVALRFALEEARRRGPDTVLEAVLAFDPMPYTPGMELGYAMPPPTDKLEAEANRVLLEALEREHPGDVIVDPIVIADHPAHALLKQCEGADLCIIGSRGHGGFAGLLLGSTSIKVSTHATCPVTVVHGD